MYNPSQLQQHKRRTSNKTDPAHRASRAEPQESTAATPPPPAAAKCNQLQHTYTHGRAKETRRPTSPHPLPPKHTALARPLMRASACSEGKARHSNDQRQKALRRREEKAKMHSFSTPNPRHGRQASMGGRESAMDVPCRAHMKVMSIIQTFSIYVCA
ncbi:uncharacterized protein BKA78DRAFT_179603 [Phyllosticta capitalensis]|uniref:uncharacterized protein n=1 Tax=Phyllosticta capitalensis TaxID=121624 RepID=UPI00313263DF